MLSAAEAPEGGKPTAGGKTNAERFRCLKREVARQMCQLLVEPAVNPHQ